MKLLTGIALLLCSTLLLAVPAKPPLDSTGEPVAHAARFINLLTSQGTITDLAFSPDGRYLASIAGGLNWIYLWNVASGRLHRVLKGFEPSTYPDNLFFLTDDDLLLSTNGNSTRLWNYRTGELIDTLVHSDAFVGRLHLIPKTRLALITDPLEQTSLWHLGADGLFPHALLSPDPGHYQAIAVDSRGQRLALADREGQLQLWCIGQDRPLLKFPDAGSKIHRLAFSPDGAHLVSAHTDGAIRLWDTKSGLQLAAREEGDSAVRALAFSPDGRWLMAGREDGRLLQLEPATLRSRTSPEHFRIDGVDQPVLTMAFSPDNRLLAFGTGDRIRVRDMASADRVFLLAGHNDWLFKVRLHPSGTRVATAHKDHQVRIWDLTSSRLDYRLTEPENWVIDLAFSPDGSRLAAGARDGRLYQWNSYNGKLIEAVGPHANTVTSVAFSPDGNQIMTGSWDHTHKVIDLTSQKEMKNLSTQGLGQFSSYSDPVWDPSFAPQEGGRRVAWSPRGKLIAAGASVIDKDGWLAVWDASSNKHDPNPSLGCLQSDR